ncbi:polysaccharide deacetylase family protein [Streptomyces durbertensis]|uniref:Polysaccharide deacetylase family protein n=1 Tax=Streptomyces durbertensis TaxID=2448886 RepID=A0ABR6EBY2_9ACTN|nr:polysaccharide deacetylase family protein [Streptomyces durbertensis]MBB1241994.1 polysaccharide deacetylase family protein [Streptomyces durbertensis]
MLVLAAALLASCAAPPASDETGRAKPAEPAAKPPPALGLPLRGGLSPVFEHGPRDADRPAVALTFDADMTADQGPRAAGGERFDNPGLVDALRELRVPATVFMTGMWARTYPRQARAIDRDPLFEVANHSYSHHAFTEHCHGLPTLPPDRAREEVTRAYAALREAGVRSATPYFRFPGGCHDKRALRAVGQAGVTTVQWDVVGGDAFNPDAGSIVRQVLDGVRPGSVVVLHCTLSAAPATEQAVRRVVPELRRRGYRLVKVSELVSAELRTADAKAGPAGEPRNGPVRS